jgi:hypothetical protein
MPPSRLIVAWHADDTNPLLHSFVELAAPGSRSRRASTAASAGAQ